MFKGLKTLIAIWKIASWLRQEKKVMEKDADAYFTQERALEWRLKMEKIFHALETGNGNIAQLPGPVKWLFHATTLDERIGIFGMFLLKSKKLEEDNNAVLNEPYNCH